MLRGWVSGIQGLARLVEVGLIWGSASSRYDSTRGATSSRSERMSAASCNDENDVGLAVMRPAQQRRARQEDLIDRGAASDVVLHPNLAQVLLAGHQRHQPTLVRVDSRACRHSSPAHTMRRPSIMIIFDCSGAKAALM